MSRALGLLGLWCAVAHAQPSPSPTPSPIGTPLAWSAVPGPARGPAEAIGGYSAGCLRGGVRLPLVGAGFRVARPARGRVWGHPSLVRFLRQLGAQAKARKLPTLFVGDLGQARGGPSPSGHASHQTGLDVDLAYAAPQNGNPPSMLDEKRMRPAQGFSAKVVRLLQLAAGGAEVDRIFVHPALKRGLCQARGDRAWLRKLRPWWGHHDHFHVRMACPEGNRDCVAQPPLAAGDGCGEIAWWFSAEAQADRQKAHDTYSAKVGAAPALPPRCGAILDAK